MPYLRRRSRRMPRAVVTYVKNSVSLLSPAAAAAKTTIEIAKAVSQGVYSNLNVTEVTHGSYIRKIWCEFWVEGTADVTIGTTNSFDAYIWKNTGNNLTAPTPGTQGSSNEKRFIFKTWKGLLGPSRTNGQPFYFFRGWIPVPRSMQRMATDDRIQMVFISTGVASLVCNQWIYKWQS